MRLSQLCDYHRGTLGGCLARDPHFTSEEIQLRVEGLYRQCLDCQGQPSVLHEHLGRELPPDAYPDQAAA